MPTNRFLYEDLDSVADFGDLSYELPDSITRNLNPDRELRPYQTDAFARFLRCHDKGAPGLSSPLHLLFNMATGSGKTLIMAGLILRLYEKGYRNFLFFVDKTNIVEKTKDNFLNPASSKYLFNGEIVVDGRRVRVSAVDNFAAANPRDINIHFTTIQGLHSRLTTVRENSVSLADFGKHKIALLSDEAQRMNVSTRNRDSDDAPLLTGTWENTVEKIFHANDGNILLEFTATHDYANSAMHEKYLKKVVIRYDLAEFRRDRYSKDVVLVRSDFGLRERILQALILSQYRREAAAKHQINLKPVILFKSRTIAESKQVQEDFRAMVDGLTAGHIAEIRRSEVPVVRRAFAFFRQNRMDGRQLAARLKSGFKREFCLSTNSAQDGERNQILLNSLEDKDNPIRAIFAVQKLTEGWDVLNLFDIVRCHETRGSPKKTIAEAQLIGRGARYFPFTTSDNDDRYRRKFDDEGDNELRVLEEMHYHSINDSEYIADIRRALADSGISDDKDIKHDLTLKPSFKNTELYKLGVIWLNKRERKNYGNVASFADLGVSRTNYRHSVATGAGTETSVFGDNDGAQAKSAPGRNLALKTIPRNVVESAVARNSFFALKQLRQFFPHLDSINDFISSENYLGGLKIAFYGGDDAAESRREQLAAVRGLLVQIEREIRAQDADYAGTNEFSRNPVRKVFHDKVLKFSASNPRGRPDEQFARFVSGQKWCAFDTVVGTSEEKEFVYALNLKIQELQERYKDIYLLRNEGHFAIYNFADGRPFQPDFALFLRAPGGETLVYQIFIEPKAVFLAENEEWKKKFLCEIRRRYAEKLLSFGGKNYRLVGLPFFNAADKNKFFAELDAALDE